MHLKFNYLYRDAGNYKNYGFVIFSNGNNEDPETLEKTIREHLIDGEFFYPEDLVKPVFFDEYNEELDHGWHEFDSVEETTEEPTDARDIEDFIADLQK